MTGITDSISNLLSSIFDIFRGLFNTLLSGIQSIAAVVGTLVESIFDLTKAIFQFLLSKSSLSRASSCHLGESTAHARIGNIAIIGILAVAFVGYTYFQQQQRQGKTVTGAKKTS